jgi:hypothetical protein
MSRSSFTMLALFGAIALVSASCSQLPTAPTVDATLGRAGSDQGVLRTGDPDSPIVGQSGAINSITLAPGDSATLHAGNFTVVFHKNSLKQGATITVVQPDPNVMEVEFEVTPASANDFQVPVKVIADCSRDPLDQVQNETMYQWDGQWQEATGVSLDTVTRSLSVHVHQLLNGRVAQRGLGASNKTSN